VTTIQDPEYHASVKQYSKSLEQEVMKKTLFSSSIDCLLTFSSSGKAQLAPTPLQFIGPEGVDQIVRGLNITYEVSRGYRAAYRNYLALPALRAKVV